MIFAISILAYCVFSYCMVMFVEALKNKEESRTYLIMLLIFYGIFMMCLMMCLVIKK